MPSSLKGDDGEPGKAYSTCSEPSDSRCLRRRQSSSRFALEAGEARRIWRESNLGGSIPRLRSLDAYSHRRGGPIHQSKASAQLPSPRSDRSTSRKSFGEKRLFPLGGPDNNPALTIMPTVLLIEDDVESRRRIARLFTRHGWDVIEALEGKAGIDLAFAKRPDAIVCDLLLPKMSGLQVCRAIREKLDLARIIIIAGRRYNIDPDAVLEAGGDAYFVKPLKWEELAAAIKRPRRRAGKLAGRQSAKLKFHPPSTRIKFWGVRGSIPVPGPTTIGYGGNTTCVEVRTNGDIIILDAGSGIRELGLALNREFGSAPINLTLCLPTPTGTTSRVFHFSSPPTRQEHDSRVGYQGAREGLATILAARWSCPSFR